MEIKIKKDEFLKGLYLAQSIADRKSTMPILANALIRSEGKDSIVCAATDLRVSVVAESKAEVLEEGGLSITAKHLFDIIKNVPGQDIHFKKTENNWAEITSGKAHYQVVGMSSRDFPRLPDHSELEFVEVDAKIFCDMISKTIFSVSTDETRRHLSGILMEWKGSTATMVSTDGHRLSKIEMELGEGLNLEEGVIIPRKGLLEIRRLLDSLEGTCDLGLKDGNLVIRAKDVVLTIKLVDSKFPPYDQVVPKSNDKQIVLDRLLFLDSLKRISIMSSDRNKGIRIDLEPGQLRVSSDNPDLGEAHEDLDIDYDGEKLSIGFDARYFLDVLNEIDDEQITLEFSGELDPGLVRPEKSDKYIGVVMPMRL